MTEIQLRGDFAQVSIWDDTWERNGGDAGEAGLSPLRGAEYPRWQRALMKRPEILNLVGGIEVARKLELMLIPANAWNDGRGQAVGFPVYQDGVLVNLVRRFFDGRQPRYQGLRGRGHQFWPDRSSLPALEETLLLVCGMRDVCTARRYGVSAYTTTGGVAYWPDEWLEWLAPARELKVIFDSGEEDFALKLVRRLRWAGAKAAWMRRLPAVCKVGEDLSDLDRRFGAESWIKQQMEIRPQYSWAPRKRSR